MIRCNRQSLRAAWPKPGAFRWCSAVLLTWLVADVTLSQSSPNQPVEPAKASVTPPVERGAGQPVEPPVTRGAEAGCGSHDAAGAAVPQPSAEGPQPRYVCESKVVTLDPVWAGSPIQATWTIKNTGEGDLSIKLKGG